MWEVKIEVKGYNRIYFKFEDLASASSFLETAQKHCEDKLEISIEKIFENEGEEE